MIETAIIIVHYQNAKDTYDCVKSILDGLTPAMQPYLIIVANTPLDNILLPLSHKYKKIRLIKTNENIGVAAGNNCGIKEALDLDCRYIILLNNDTLIGPGLIEKMIAYAQKNKSIGIISPKIYFAPGFEFHKERYKKSEQGKVIWYAGGILDWSNIYGLHRGVDEVDRGQYDRAVDTDFATGCCMLVKREVIEKIGFSDEKYFLYFEDIDYCLKARKNNFQIKYYPEVFLWHKNAASSGKPGSSTHIYYQTRNRLYFGFKYASIRTKKSLFIDSIRLLLKGGVYKKAVLDYYFGNMRRGSLWN